MKKNKEDFKERAIRLKNRESKKYSSWNEANLQTAQDERDGDWMKRNKGAFEEEIYFLSSFFTYFSARYSQQEINHQICVFSLWKEVHQPITEPKHEQKKNEVNKRRNSLALLHLLPFISIFRALQQFRYNKVSSYNII